MYVPQCKVLYARVPLFLQACLVRKKTFLRTMQEATEQNKDAFVSEFEELLPKLVDVLKLLQDCEIEEREVTKVVDKTSHPRFVNN